MTREWCRDVRSEPVEGDLDYKDEELEDPVANYTFNAPYDLQHEPFRIILQEVTAEQTYFPR